MEVAPTLLTLPYATAHRTLSSPTAASTLNLSWHRANGCGLWGQACWNCPDKTPPCQQDNASQCWAYLVHSSCGKAVCNTKPMCVAHAIVSTCCACRPCKAQNTTTSQASMLVHNNRLDPGRSQGQHAVPSQLRSSCSTALLPLLGTCGTYAAASDTFSGPCCRSSCFISWLRQLDAKGLSSMLATPCRRPVNGFAAVVTSTAPPAASEQARATAWPVPPLWLASTPLLPAVID